MSADSDKLFPNLPALRKHLPDDSFATSLTEAALAATSLTDAKTRLDAIVDERLVLERKIQAKLAGDYSFATATDEAGSTSEPVAPTAEPTDGWEPGAQSGAVS